MIIGSIFHIAEARMSLFMSELVVDHRISIGDLGTYLVVYTRLGSEADIALLLECHAAVGATKLEVTDFLALVECATYFGGRND